AGSVYVYAVVKSSSALQYPPKQGDYIGIYGYDWPSLPSVPNVVSAANTMTGGININMTAAVNNVTGTITFPAGADYSDILLALDSDGDGSNGGIVFLDINQIPGGTGTEYGYGLLCIFPGSWYIYGMVDNDGSGLPGAPTSTDFVGQTGPHSMDPASANGPYNFTWTEIP
ncbi:MAG TPA: hypothetical protein P5511_10595, partial [Candidatus Goldiibacteriota bacterium]|nr:hypothetical protein [Candidatus Goldiibacteriota bacterium]